MDTDKIPVSTKDAKLIEHIEPLSQASNGRNVREPLSPEELVTALSQAKETHAQIISWIMALDQKVIPILGATSALVAGCLIVLAEAPNMAGHHNVTKLIIAISLIPQVFSLMMGVSAVSPSLKIARWGTNRHEPDRTGGGPKSQTFFGQIALYKDSSEYIQAARALFIDEERLLDNALEEIYINSVIAVEKSRHIAWCARGLFAAIMILILSGATFLLNQ